MPYALEDIFRFGTIFRNRRGRVSICYKKLWVSYPRLIWNLMNPEDPAGPDESIHHINRNHGDNSILNFEKMKTVDHNLFHATKTVRQFIHPIEIKRRKRNMGEGQARLMCRGDSKFNHFEAGGWN